MIAYKLIAAYILDIIFGDPYTFPHPVRFIGRAIEFLETRLRRSKLNLKLSGIILGALIVGGTYVIVYIILYISSSVNFWLEFIIAGIFIYTSLSVKCLAIEGLKIYDLLNSNDLPEAREQLSMIVGRDTQNLDEGEIIRAAVETIAENTVDGIISPIFYACLGGAPLALAFKAVNTLDSMVGYKNEKYIELGWFSARLDDIANWIPARLSALLIPLSAILPGMLPAKSIKTIIRDGGKSSSPNAGLPEAGFAGALGIQLGGASYYGGKRQAKPFIGEMNKNIEIKDIKKSIRLMYVVSFMAILFAVVIRVYI